MKIDGQCHCGAIAFEAEVEPDSIRICHCTDCQTISGSAFRANVTAPAETFRLLRGDPKSYIKTAESGSRRRHMFCGDCGTPISSSAPDNPPQYSLRIGSIAQRAQLRPAAQIWHRSALPWLGTLSTVPAKEQG
jgi:hypothetical protein